MLRFIRQGQRWIVTALVVMVGAVFVLFFGPWDFTQSGGITSVPVEVDGIQYTVADVARVRQNLDRNLRESLGDQYDEAAGALQLDRMAMNELVQRAVMAGEARDLGLTASDDEVNRLIRQAFSDFRTADGELDEAAARSYVEYEWGSVREFKDAVRTDLAIRKLSRVLRAASGVSEAEARDSVRYREEKVRIAFVALDPATPPEQIAPPQGEVDEFERQNRERIEAYYQENRERYREPERVRLRHVLVKVPPVAEESELEAARASAEAVRERLVAGEDMAAVAREVSDDEGSAERGGDLGLIPRHDLSRPLRDAAAALEEGELSQLVRSEQGFHVLRVEERRPAETLPLDAVSTRIARELLEQERAERWAAETTAELQAMIDEGRSLEEAARELRLNIERTGLFARRPDGFIAGLGDSVEAQTAAFAVTPEHPTWPEPIEVGERTVFLQLLEHQVPEPGALEAQVEQERDRMEARDRQRVEQAWIADRRAELDAAGRIRADPSALEN